MLIYIATNMVNGKQYVGQTINSLKLRKKQHINNALNGNSDNNYLHNAIQRYGQDNFTWTILHDNITTIEDLNRLEIFYIELYDTFENGYNLTLGGGGCLGHKLTQEIKDKIKKSLLGFKHSKQARQNMSKAAKGMLGRKHSEKSKKKMSKSKAGVYKLGKHPRARSVVVYGYSFDTVTEAAVYLKIPRGTLTSRLRHSSGLYYYKDKGVMPK